MGSISAVSLVRSLILPKSSFGGWGPGGWGAFCLMSDGQEISTIEWHELKNRFPSFFVHK